MNKNEWRKISVQFRTLSSQMLKVESDSDIGFISGFVDYIDSTEALSAYIKSCHTKEYDIAADMQAKSQWQSVALPTKQEDLIDYVYQILKLICDNGKLLRIWSFGYTTSNKFSDKYQAFMRKTVEPFIHALRTYIELQLIDSSDNADLSSIDEKIYIFLSYCQKDHNIADIVDSTISKSVADFAQISRDVRDIKYRESIKKFMETVGTHDYVIMIISDNYLKSRNCLYEMLEVMRDRNYGKKILFIVLSDDDAKYYDDPLPQHIGAKVYGIEGQAEYISYWQQQNTNLKHQIEKIDDPILSIEYAKELKIITKIQLDLPEFMAHLREHNGINFSKLMQSDFKEIIDVIRQ